MAAVRLGAGRQHRLQRRRLGVEPARAPELVQVERDEPAEREEHVGEGSR